MGKECEPDTLMAKGEERTRDRLSAAIVVPPGLENRQLPSEVLSSNTVLVWNKTNLW